MRYSIHTLLWCALFRVLTHEDDMEGQDAMIAQLMGMGFQPEDIEDYQLAMAASSESFSMQAATEWSAHTLEYLN